MLLPWKLQFHRYQKWRNIKAFCCHSKHKYQSTQKHWNQHPQKQLYSKQTQWDAPCDIKWFISCGFVFEITLSTPKNHLSKGSTVRIQWLSRRMMQCYFQQQYEELKENCKELCGHPKVELLSMKISVWGNALWRTWRIKLVLMYDHFRFLYQFDPGKKPSAISLFMLTCFTTEASIWPAALQNAITIIVSFFCLQMPEQVKEPNLWRKMMMMMMMMLKNWTFLDRPPRNRFFLVSLCL